MAEEDLRDIIIDLYAAALDSGDLAVPASRLMRSIGGHSALLQASTTMIDGSGVPLHSEILFSQNLDPDVVKRYGEYWVQHDPWVNAAAPMNGQLLDFDWIVPPERYAASALWNELRPEAFHALGMVFRAQSGIFASFGIHRTRSQGSFSLEHVARARIGLPHLRRAMAAMLDRPRNAPAADAVGLIEAFTVPVALMNAASQAMGTNLAMRALAGRNDGLVLKAGGMIQMLDARADRWLHDAVAASCAGLPLAVTLECRASRPSGLRPLHLVVTPLRHGRALLKVTAPSEPSLDPRRVAALFDLTLAEARVAVAIHAGMTVHEVARQGKVSPHTVRAQLKSVLAKTETRRQSELVAVLSSCAN